MNELYKHNTEIHNTNAAKEVLAFILPLLDCKSVVDIGCGLGTWISVAKEMGVKRILGLDGDYVPRDLLLVENEEFITCDLRNEIVLDVKYDLAICLEVAEHIPEENAEQLIESLCKISDVILFSAAIPDQDGQNHINEQPFEYWQKKYSNEGFYFCDILRPKFWDNPKVEWWYRQNMFLVVRKGTHTEFKAVEGKLHTAVHPERYSEIFKVYQELIQLKYFDKQVLLPKRSIFQSFISKLK